MDRSNGFLDQKLETSSWDEQSALLEQKLAATVAHAYANAPAVKDKFDSVGVGPGDIKTTADLAKLPVTTKMDLVELQKKTPPFGGLLAVGMDEVSNVFISPGPIYDPVARGEGWGFEQAFHAAGFRPGDLCVNTFGYQMSPAGMMLGESLSNIGCSVIPTGVGEREAQVSIMKDLPVKGYVGMASFLVQIGEKAIEMGLNPKDFGLEVAWSIAEPMPDSLRFKVEEMFGLYCRQGYGTADVGAIGFECYHKGGWHITNRAIVEIVDPTNGEPLPYGTIGEVVVTQFHRGYTLIRFGTGDLSALDMVECECGRKSPKLRGWLGRSDQLVKIKGMFVHPGQIQKAMSSFAELTKYRAIATNADQRDKLTLHVEGQADQATGEAIASQMREVVRLGVVVQWCEPGTLPDDGQVLEDKRTWD